jgi:hypothetical protein
VVHKCEHIGTKEQWAVKIINKKVNRSRILSNKVDKVNKVGLAYIMFHCRPQIFSSGMH